MGLSYYVYYRIDPIQVKTAMAIVETQMRAIVDATGVPGRLLRKRGEPNLWMEVYENVADAALFEHELALAAEAIEKTASLQTGTGRHVECFEE